MFCFNCGEEISSNAAYCPHCGCRTYLPKNSPMLQMKTAFMKITMISANR